MKNSLFNIALGFLVASITLFFGAWLFISGQAGDFKQFILDRRFTAGQLGPDPGATCQYNIEGERLLITRKSRGKKKLHEHKLPGTLQEVKYAGQNAAIIERDRVQTYNCVNQELLTHNVSSNNRQVLGAAFSSNGKNLAIFGKQEQKKYNFFVEVFTFAKNPDQSLWNKGLSGTTDGPGIGSDEIISFNLVGQSLFWVTAGQKPNQHKANDQHESILLFVYNFRKSHEKNPLNAWDPDTKKPYLVEGELVGYPVFDRAGRMLEIEVAGEASSTHYTYDFNCRLGDFAWESKERQNNQGDATNFDDGAQKKPCLWKKSGS